MVLIARRGLILLAIVSCGSVVLAGVGAYLVVSGAARRSAEELRFLAETILYLSILLTIVVLSISAVLILRSRSISLALDRIIDLARYGAQPVEESLRKIGPLGAKISELNLALSDLSEKRLLRIGALNEIATFLVNNSALALAITDVTGRVFLTSPEFLKRLRVDRPAVQRASIAGLLEGLDFPGIVSRLEKERTVIEWDEGNMECRFFPVFNRRNALSNVACILGRQEVLTESAARNGEAPSSSRVARLLRRYLSGRAERRADQP